MAKKSMVYRLALDVGTNSLGWGIFSLDENFQPKAIAKLGVRIFSNSRVPKTGQSLAVKRREARSQRRQRDRYLKRKNTLIKTLVEFNFFPAREDERKALVFLNPYELRHLAVTEELSPEKVARAFFHINERRGFKSNRKVDTKDSDTGLIKSAIKSLKDQLTSPVQIKGVQIENPTVGQYLYSRQEEGKTVRAKLRKQSDSSKANYEFYLERAMLEDEFKRVWSYQKQFNAELYSDNAFNRIFQAIFYQRPLKPVPVGKCTILPEEPRAPKALPSTQLSRVLQEINNLKLVNSLRESFELSLDSKKLILDLLLTNNKVSFKSLINKLDKKGVDVEGKTFNLEDAKRQELMGADTFVKIHKKIPNSNWTKLPLRLQDTIIEILLDAATDEEAIDNLVKLQSASENAVFNWTKDQISLLVTEVSLMADYGNLSKKVNQKIIPFLLEGDLYHKAIEKAGLGSHSYFGPTDKVNELPYYGKILTRSVAFGKPESDIEEQKYGKIANPTVHVALNQIRKVVNALIKKYGKPHDIVLEVTRDLKNNAFVKYQIEKEQAAAQAYNKELIAKYAETLGLSEVHIKALSGNQRATILEKEKLWAEQSKGSLVVCVYSGRTISRTQLHSSEVEIDHIFPWSQSLDDSLANKVLCFSSENREKTNRSPFEAFGNDTSKYANIIRNAFSHLPKNKAERFTEAGYKAWLNSNKDFLARALNDTAYIAKITREYLACLIDDQKIVCSPGRLTAMLRRKFELDTLLSPANGVKNRDDHRHHALDAAVIGILDRNFLRNMAYKNSRGLPLTSSIEQFKLPFSTYKEHVKRALDEVVVSHKPDFGYQGQFSEDTALQIVDLENNKVKKKVEKKKTEGGVEISTKIEVVKNLLLITDTSTRHKRNKDGSLRPYKAYETGSNYCMDVVLNEKDKIEEEMVTTYDAYQYVKKHDEMSLASRKVSIKSGRPLKDCIKIGDYYLLDIGLCIVVKLTKGIITLVLHTEGASSTKRKEIFKNANTLLNNSTTIKVTVSEIGVISKKVKP